MKIGIYDINDNSSLNYKERLEIYKQVGFTSVGLYLDDNYMANGESYLSIIEYARSIGLEVNQVHLDYKISNYICDESNDIYFDYVKEKLSLANRLNIKYVVVHASKGDNPPLINNNCLNRLKSVIKEYENTQTYLCFENVRNNNNLDLIVRKNINHVGVCYDLGHAHCYDNEYNILNKYKEKILCSHLHNNYGSDSHNSLDEGDINCREIISFINNNVIDNCLEVFPKRGSFLTKEEFIDFVKKNYDEFLKCI